MYTPGYSENTSLRERRFSRRSEANGNEHSSCSKSVYSGKRRNRKHFQKSCRHKKCISIAQKSADDVNELKYLVSEFVSHRFSAAGISYIAQSRSRWRKLVWFTAIVLSLSFMGFMTYNVIKEYMNFPKMLIREERLTPSLMFPAVSLCSLNPIVNITGKTSSVYKLMRLKELIDKAEVVQSNQQLQDACYINPLCEWLWFNETCLCTKKPCSTEFCLKENNTHCACSIDICKDFKSFASCYRDFATERCICPTDMLYTDSLDVENKATRNEFKIDLDNELDVTAVFNLIRSASTNDLTDIDEALMPTVSDLMNFGIKFDNLVISCSFDGEGCARENFTVLYHPTYGRCYMFNYLGNIASPEKAIYAYNYGSSSGLRLILQVMKQDKIDILNSETGARVTVHNPYALPFVQEEGLNVRPHDISAIEVKQSIIERLKSPYGTCVDDGSHLKFNLSAGQPYSLIGCQKACRKFYAEKDCNCTKRSHIMGSVFYGRTMQIKFCKEGEQNKCVTDVISKIELGIIKCDCKPPCLEVKYNAKVSSSDLNEKFYRAVKNIRTFFTENGVHKTISASNEKKLMVGVKVYYSTFQVDVDKEQASYSWETLIANIGGNLGFFMGLTLVTFVEVLEFFWDILVATIRRYRDPKGGSDKRFQVSPTNH